MAKRMKLAGGFTLIELLMVVFVIGILAGLTIQVIGPISNTKKRKGMDADLKRLVTAIENYKAKFGHYPPDNNNPNSFPAGDREWKTPLFYELTGTLVVNKNQFARLDGAQKDLLDGGVNTPMENILGVRGFVNASDNRANVKVFLSDLRPVHHASAFANPEIEVLTATVLGTNVIVAPNGQRFNPWRYNSSNPIRNPGKFDLWAEVVIGNATNVIGNWHK